MEVRWFCTDKDESSSRLRLEKLLLGSQRPLVGLRQNPGESTAFH